MIYSANISTPKNTAKTALQRTRIHVTKGLVYKVEFYFPTGSAGLLGVKVQDGLYQVWPSTMGEYFVGEGRTISFDDMYLMDSEPFEFQVYTYNLDDTYDHAVSVSIGLVSQDVYVARFMPTKGYEYLAELIEKLAAEKQEQVKIQQEVVVSSPEEWLKSQGIG